MQDYKQYMRNLLCFEAVYCCFAMLFVLSIILNDEFQWYSHPFCDGIWHYTDTTILHTVQYLTLCVIKQPTELQNYRTYRKRSKATVQYP
jgi:hypothetical protein